MFKRMPISFLWIMLAGLVLGIVIGFKSVIPFLYWGDLNEFNWYKSALPHLLNYLFWPFLVPFIYWTFQRYRIGKEAHFRERLISILMSLCIPLVHEFVTTVIYFIILEKADEYHFDSESWATIRAAFPGVYIGRIVEFWIIYGLFAAFDYYRAFKNKQMEIVLMESQLKTTKLAVLRMQLQPHFLFNALNSISSLMDSDVSRAQLMTARLGDLLRGILRQDDIQLISLEDEMRYVFNYLEIEKIRFEDRLKLEIDVNPKLLRAKVPVFLIQTLVENAFKHGLAKSSDIGYLKIMVAEPVPGDLSICIQNNSPESPSRADPFLGGIGLRNLKERLDNLYGDRHVFNVQQTANSTFTALVQIPLNREDETD